FSTSRIWWIGLESGSSRGLKAIRLPDSQHSQMLDGTGQSGSDVNFEPDQCESRSSNPSRSISRHASRPCERVRVSVASILHFSSRAPSRYKFSRKHRAPSTRTAYSAGDQENFAANRK